MRRFHFRSRTTTDMTLGRPIRPSDATTIRLSGANKHCSSLRCRRCGAIISGAIWP